MRNILALHNTMRNAVFCVFCVILLFFVLMPAASGQKVAEKTVEEAARAMRQQFGGGAPVLDRSKRVLPLLGVLSVVILSVTGLYLYTQYTSGQTKQHGIDNSGALFRELSSAHSISWLDRMFLKRLAKALNISDPSLLMIEPRSLSSAYGHPYYSKFQAKIRTFEEKFFGTGTVIFGAEEQDSITALLKGDFSPSLTEIIRRSVETDETQYAHGDIPKTMTMSPFGKGVTKGNTPTQAFSANRAKTSATPAQSGTAAPKLRREHLANLGTEQERIEKIVSKEDQKRNSAIAPPVEETPFGVKITQYLETGMSNPAEKPDFLSP